MKKKLTQSVPFKTLAFFLAVLCLISAAVGTLGCIWLAEKNIYLQSENEILQTVLTDTLYQESYELMDYYLQDVDLESLYDPQQTNLRFCLKSADGNQISTFSTDENIIASCSFTRTFEQWQYFSEDEPVPASFPVTLFMGVSKDLQASDSYALLYHLVHTGYQLRVWLPIIVAALWLLGAVCVVFLFCAAGHRAGVEGVTLNPMDRTPLDVYLAGVGAIAFCLVYVIADQLYYAGTAFQLVFLLIAALVLVSLGLGLLLSLATRAKSGTVFSNTLCWKLLKACGRAFRWAGRKLVSLLSSVPLVWKTFLGLAVFCFFDLLFTIGLRYNGGVLLLFWMAEKAILVPLILWVALNLRRLQKAGERIAAGEVEYRLDTHGMVGDFRRFGDTLNSIGEGLGHAVDERMKSERMKTELITNVSHDIKTPLTSIINYVDLIKKEEPQSETMCQYVEVLERQSVRLKKLIEDLIEVSKASSGVLATQPESCELGVLLQQACGEYAEKLESAGLQLVVQQPEEAVRIWADGRHLWRIVDNLFGNVCKYAQSGTRVYLSLIQQNGRAIITIRNVSREALNISGEELLERFVRGDRARHTEGSGLGLSIARSLTELQGGTLQLDVDGDLFKVTLSFAIWAQT